MKDGRRFYNLMISITIAIIFCGYGTQAIAQENADNKASALNEQGHNAQDQISNEDTNDVEENLQPDENVKIVFDKLVHDYGDVAPNSKNTCEFKFTNEGTGTLIVKKKIATTCGCTAPKLEKEKYLPGESGIIKVVLTANSRPGHMQKHLYVNNNSKDERIMLTIKANVIEKISVEPSRINLALDKENAGCPDITVKSKDGTAFTITRVAAPDNAIIAELDTSAKSTQFVIEPKVNMEKIKTQSNGVITIFLTHYQVDKVDIPYSVTPLFKADPATIIALNSKPGEPISRTVYVMSNYNEPFEVESIEADESLVKLVNKERDDKNRYKLDFEIMPPQQSDKRHFSSTTTVNIVGGHSLKINIIGSLAVSNM